MKTKSKWIIFAAALVIASLNLSAQKQADLAGTWAGEATLEGQPPNNLTLVLSLVEGKLEGHMTGEHGTLNETPAKDFLFENGDFSFSIVLEGPDGELAVQFKMKVEGNSMSGELSIPDMGMAGTWEAEKQK